MVRPWGRSKSDCRVLRICKGILPREAMPHKRGTRGRRVSGVYGRVRVRGNGIVKRRTPVHPIKRKLSVCVRARHGDVNLVPSVLEPLCLQIGYDRFAFVVRKRAAKADELRKLPAAVAPALLPVAGKRTRGRVLAHLSGDDREFVRVWIFGVDV